MNDQDVARDQAITKARIAKAMKLADHLRVAEVTADEAELADDDVWSIAARMSGVKPPSDSTKALVVSYLRQAEATADQDPFAGLPAEKPVVGAFDVQLPLTERNDMTGTIVRVNDLPWGDLGTDVSDCHDMAAVLTKAKLDWGVKTVPVAALVSKEDVDGFPLPSTPMPVTIPDRKAIVRDDTGQGLGVAGNYWTPISNGEGAWLIEALMADGLVKPIRAGTTHQDRRTFIVGTFNGALQIGGIDPVDTIFALWNRHDGRGALTSAVLHIRRGCSNQLPGIVNAIAGGTIAGRKSKSRERLFNWNIRHTTKYQDRLKLAQEAIQRTQKANEVFWVTAEALLTRPFGIDDMKAVAERLFPTEGAQITTRTRNGNAERQAAVVGLYREADNLNNVRGTAWGGWNAIAEYADHGLNFRDTKVSSKAESRFMSIVDPSGTAHLLKVKGFSAVAQKVGVGGPGALN